MAPPSSSSTTSGASSETATVSVNEYGDLDTHNFHIWFWEPRIKEKGGVLTKDGLNQIAHHKYVAGHYTTLDSILSPYLWEPLVQFCPMWLAPNLITTIGGSFGLLSLFISQYYIDHWKRTGEEPPQWLYFVNATCMFLYYTLDCMDGKQARRTQSSSPLGQLFDHGVDCLTILSLMRMIQCINLIEDECLLYIQISLQLSFWQAQWEEYHTGILPHAQGDLGVTETNYGFALWSLMTGIFGREKYDQVMYVFGEKEAPALVALFGGVRTIRIKHCIGMGWGLLVLGLMAQSIGRVYVHKQKDETIKSPLISYLWSLSQFTSPILLATFASPAGSNAMGLCYCLITIKIIVFSMARMAYASIQMDVLPYVISMIFLNYYPDLLKQYLPGPSSSMIYGLVDIYYFARLVYWIHEAIKQLCKRLDIPLFRIKPKPKQKKS